MLFGLDGGAWLLSDKPTVAQPAQQSTVYVKQTTTPQELRQGPRQGPRQEPRQDSQLQKQKPRPVTEKVIKKQFTLQQIFKDDNEAKLNAIRGKIDFMLNEYEYRFVQTGVKLPQEEVIDLFQLILQNDYRDSQGRYFSPYVSHISVNKINTIIQDTPDEQNRVYTTLYYNLMVLYTKVQKNIDTFTFIMGALIYLCKHFGRQKRCVINYVHVFSLVFNTSTQQCGATTIRQNVYVENGQLKLENVYYENPDGESAMHINALKICPIDFVPCMYIGKNKGTIVAIHHDNILQHDIMVNKGQLKQKFNNFNLEYTRPGPHFSEKDNRQIAIDEFKKTQDDKELLKSIFDEIVRQRYSLQMELKKIIDIAEKKENKDEFKTRYLNIIKKRLKHFEKMQVRVENGATDVFKKHVENTNKELKLAIGFLKNLFDIKD